MIDDNCKRGSYKNLIKNIPLIVSGLAFIVLVMFFLKTIATVVSAAIILVAVYFLENTFRFWKINLSFVVTLITSVVLAINGYFFYGAMCSSEKVYTAAELIGISSAAVALFITLIVCVIAFYFVSYVVCFALSRAEFLSVNDVDKSADTRNITKKEIVFVLLTAILTISICSKSSPLYPFNDWGDSNIFFTIGKSMLYGKVPYRDLFDHKGPLLYMLHAFAAIISRTTFLGVYFLEIIACAFFLFYSFKIIRFYSQSAGFLLIPVLSVLVYTAQSFCHGDSAEELCLPFFTYALYIGIKSLRKQHPTNLECIIVGATAACVLWIKFTLLGFYIGWIIVPAVLLIKEKQIKKLVKMLLYIIVGVVIVSIPILIYFIANGAMDDLWTVYFYNNLFAYSSSSSSNIFVFSLLKNLAQGIANVYWYSLLPITVICFGMLFINKTTLKYELYFIFTSVVGMFLFIYVGGVTCKYYSLPLVAFTSVGLAMLFLFIQNSLKNLRISWSSSINKCIGVFVCIICVVYAFVVSENTYLLRYKKSDMPQYQFAKIISQVENATLLNYGVLDCGVYTTTGIVPNCKYFFRPNINIDEIMETQDEFVNNGKVDFVVTCNSELESDLYMCVSKASFCYEGYDMEYYLYQLIE